MLKKKLFAETLGTAWLLLGGCGSAILAASFPELGIGLLGVSLAFGLSVLTMAYSIGPVSGCHLNPAVTLGLFWAKRHNGKEVLPYILAQVIGAVLGAAVLFVIASGKLGFSASESGFASNGYGDHSPGAYTLASVMLTEIVATAFFLFIILSCTSKKAAAGFAPLAIGLSLTLIHLVTIPVSNTSVNPARSLATALFAGSWALEQLWVFIVAPVLGAGLGAFAHIAINGKDT